VTDYKRSQLEREYSTALRDCVHGAGELALTHAYELGRVAAGTGIGVVELAAIHDAALREVLGTEAPPTEVDQFFAEALSPFEMTHRGFKEANERLETAVRELEAFSYSVSHDLRAPLRTISAFTQALAEELRYQLDDRCRDHLHRVPAAASRMNERIDALLERARIQRARLGRHPVEISAIATAVVEDLRRRDVTRRLGASIATDLVAEADGRLVRIALDNLIGDAWKATARSGNPHVEVGACERDGVRGFFVRDNGGARAGDPDATIGMATVRRIVERHGGRLWVEREDGGTRIVFTLPGS